MEGLYLSAVSFWKGEEFARMEGQLMPGKPRYFSEGLDFQLVYLDEEYFQANVYAYLPGMPMLIDVAMRLQEGLAAEVYGSRIGSALGVPVVVQADYWMQYVIVVDRKPVDALQPYLSSSNPAQQVRITAFRELINFIRRSPAEYHSAVSSAVSTWIAEEGFRCSRDVPKLEGAVSFQALSTQDAAREAAERGKHVAVLSFANPVESGGGILRGAPAQEESLCRCSDLYFSLISEAAKPYYRENVAIWSQNPDRSTFLGTDMVIVSPDVTMYKTDEQTYLRQTFRVDVLTCAAPLFGNPKFALQDGDLQHLLERRIRNILETAMQTSAQTLILGAFGCGAFHNPPETVARAFRNVLLQERYRYAFDEVIFAVRPGKDDTNTRAFSKYFSSFPGVV